MEPIVPPYAHLDKEAVQCIAQASFRYEVPELLLHAIVTKENGRTGQCRKNTNQSYDCGPAQINTSWIAHFAKQGVSPSQLLMSSCTNLTAAAYILKYNFLRKGNWTDAVISYNIGPNNWTASRYAVGQSYAKDVVRRWWGFHNWVLANTGQRPLGHIESSPESSEPR